MSDPPSFICTKQLTFSDPAPGVGVDDFRAADVICDWLKTRWRQLTPNLSFCVQDNSSGLTVSQMISDTLTIVFIYIWILLKCGLFSIKKRDNWVLKSFSWMIVANITLPRFVHSLNNCCLPNYVTVFVFNIWNHVGRHFLRMIQDIKILVDVSSGSWKALVTWH